MLAVEDCPNLKPRPGPEYQLVTATFRHRNARILDLRIEGTAETIGTTPNHPFWSEDKQQFVRADQLTPGERLRGLNNTFPKVLSTTERPGLHNVYNLEVHLDHVYHVANNGVLVHNGNAIPCTGYIYELVGDVDGVMHTYVGSAWGHTGRLTSSRHASALKILEGSEVRVRVYKVDLTGATSKREAARMLRVNEQQVLDRVLDNTGGVLNGTKNNVTNLNKIRARAAANIQAELKSFGSRFQEIPLTGIPWF